MTNTCEGQKIFPGTDFCRKVNDASLYLNNADALKQECNWPADYTADYALHFAAQANQCGCAEQCAAIVQKVAAFREARGLVSLPNTKH